ncbi:hypothetical protein M5K25_018625 [Dendrobium thyrsiflorum]|uniref:Transmembrane protein n=1 Tax=Dendrobium thyrsiflorum TaxID=117978 RepID=A0ABD0UJ29_DENTH
MSITEGDDNVYPMHVFDAWHVVVGLPCLASKGCCFSFYGSRLENGFYGLKYLLFLHLYFPVCLILLLVKVVDRGFSRLLDRLGMCCFWFSFWVVFFGRFRMSLGDFVFWISMGTVALKGWSVLQGLFVASLLWSLLLLVFFSVEPSSMDPLWLCFPWLPELFGSILDWPEGWMWNCFSVVI